MPVLHLFVRRLTDTALPRKTFRIIATQKFNEPLADLATKIGKFTRVRAADESAYFDCCLLGVRDLQPTNFPIPLRIVFDKPLQFLA